MNNHEIYAWQLLIEAAEVDQVMAIDTEMKEVLLALQAQPRFLELLKSPMMTIERKKEWVYTTFLHHISTRLMDFLIDLIEKDVFDFLEEIVVCYDQAVSWYLRTHAGIIEGVVYSAASLTDHQLVRLEQVFTEKLGQKVRLKEVVDPALIGGYRVEIGSHVYDDTVDLQLRQLKASLKNLDVG